MGNTLPTLGAPACVLKYFRRQYRDKSFEVEAKSLAS